MSSISKYATAIDYSTENSHFYIKFFLLDDSINYNRWGVTQQAVQKHINTFLGKPFVVTEKLDHLNGLDPKTTSLEQALRIQEKFKAGTIIDVGFDEHTGKAWARAEITDKKAQELIKQGKIRYVSPSISFRDEDIVKNSDREVITDFIAMHVAGVSDPAFGVVKAQIKGTCSGSEHECSKQLQMVQACYRCGEVHYEVAAQDDNLRSECIKHFIEDGRERDQAIAICIKDPRAHLAQKYQDDKLIQYLQSDNYKHGVEFPWDECIAKMKREGVDCPECACAAIKNRTVSHGMREGIFKDESDAISQIIDKIKHDKTYHYFIHSSLKLDNSSRESVMSEDNSKLENIIKQLQAEVATYKQKLAAEGECAEGEKYNKDSGKCEKVKEAQYQKTISDLQTEIANLKKSPIVDKIVTAMELKDEEKKTKSESLLKLPIEQLEELAKTSEVLAAKIQNTREVRMPKFQYASTNQDQFAKTAYSILKELGGK